MNVHMRGAFLMTQQPRSTCGSRIRLHREPAQRVGARQSLPGELFGRQGGRAGFYQDPGRRTRQARRSREHSAPGFIAPGFIETDITAATAARLGVDLKDFKKKAAAEIPVACVGQPEHIANIAAYFADEGAGFVSGQIVYVVGGPQG